MERPTKYVRDTASAGETNRLGAALGKRITDGLCVSLVGPLGAGKTVLIRGICRGLGVAEDVLSPTFVLFEEFFGRIPVVHVDLYRLEHESEIEEIGVFDSIGRGKVILAEWGDRSETLFAQSDVVIALGQTSASGRRIEISCTTEASPIFKGFDRW